MASRKYVDLIRDASSKYANWNPLKTMHLGDFGILNKEDGEFEKEGNIFEHEETQEIVKPSAIVVASPEEKMVIAAKAISNGEISLEPGVSFAGLAEASIKCQVKFGSKPGALLVVARPKTSYIPKPQLLKLASAMVLKDKAVVTEIVQCPAYSLYLSTAKEEVIRIAFTGSSPIPHAPGITASASIEPSWWSENTAGFYRQACDKEGIYRYTALNQLQQIRKPPKFLYRDSPIPEDDKWVPTPPPWEMLDDDGEEEEFVMRLIRGVKGLLRSAGLFQEGHIVSGSDDTTVRIWDAVAEVPLQELAGYSHSVLSVAISHDETYIVFGSDNSTVCIWDVGTDALLHELSGHSGSVYAVATSHDDKCIVSGSDDKTVRVWDACTGVLLYELTDHSGLVRSVALSQDGTRIISGSHDNTVCVWDTGTGALLHELTGHSHSVRSVAISHDGSRVVSGSNDTTIRIWDATTGTLLHELTRHFNSVSSVAFSHDDSRIISGSRDMTLRIWDIETGALLHKLTDDSGWESLVAFSQDGTFVMCNHKPFPIPPRARPLSSPLTNNLRHLCFERGWIITRNDGKRLCLVPPELREEITLSSHLAVLRTTAGVTVIRFPHH